MSYLHKIFIFILFTSSITNTFSFSLYSARPGPKRAIQNSSNLTINEPIIEKEEINTQQFVEFPNYKYSYEIINSKKQVDNLSEETNNKVPTPAKLQQSDESKPEKLLTYAVMVKVDSPNFTLPFDDFRSTNREESTEYINKNNEIQSVSHECDSKEFCNEFDSDIEVIPSIGREIIDENNEYQQFQIEDEINNFQYTPTYQSSDEIDNIEQNNEQLLPTVLTAPPQTSDNQTNLVKFNQFELTKNNDSDNAKKDETHESNKSEKNVSKNNNNSNDQQLLSIETESSTNKNESKPTPSQNKLNNTKENNEQELLNYQAGFQRPMSGYPMTFMHTILSPVPLFFNFVPNTSPMLQNHQQFQVLTSPMKSSPNDNSKGNIEDKVTPLARITEQENQNKTLEKQQKENKSEIKSTTPQNKENESVNLLKSEVETKKNNATTAEATAAIITTTKINNKEIQSLNAMAEIKENENLKENKNKENESIEPLAFNDESVTLNNQQNENRRQSKPQNMNNAYVAIEYNTRLIRRNDGLIKEFLYFN